jgi:hypothetical protein
MPREQNEFRHPWQKVAQQIVREQNPDELTQLLNKLNEAMLSEAREKVRRRLGTNLRNSLDRKPGEDQSKRISPRQL